MGRTIVAVDVPVPKILREPFSDPAEFARMLTNRVVESIQRRGKYLIFQLENGYSLSAHLKMRGQMRVDAPDAFGGERYLCARMRLDDGREWRYYDMWTWGELRLLPVGAERAGEFIPALASMGPEPLGDDFTPNTFRMAARRGPKRSVKAFLLDQGVVAGIGNIYADESLHRAGIHPERAVGTISDPEWDALHRQVRAVIGEAVDGGGTASDEFVDIGGRAGRYIPQVYGRRGEPCMQCGNTLQRMIITGRGTVFCLGCQPLAVK